MSGKALAAGVAVTPEPVASAIPLTLVSNGANGIACQRTYDSRPQLSLADATLIAEVLTGQQIDETGGIVSLESPVLERKWHELRALPKRHPP